MSWLDQRKILVPVDFSDVSFDAVDTAIDIAADNSKVTVIHVLEPMPANDIAARYADDVDEEHEQKVLKSLRERLSDSKYAGVTIESMIGNPAHDVAEFSEKNGIGLIVVPSHGRSGVSRLMIGSVAERIVRLAHCPVLVLRS